MAKLRLFTKRVRLIKKTDKTVCAFYGRKHKVEIGFDFENSQSDTIGSITT